MADLQHDAAAAFLNGFMSALEKVCTDLFESHPSPATIDQVARRTRLDAKIVESMTADLISLGYATMSAGEISLTHKAWALMIDTLPLATPIVQ